MMMEIVIKGAHSESTILIRVACSLRVCEIDKGAVNFITGRAKKGELTAGQPATLETVANERDTPTRNV